MDFPPLDLALLQQELAARDAHIRVLETRIVELGQEITCLVDGTRQLHERVYALGRTIEEKLGEHLMTQRKKDLR